MNLKQIFMIWIHQQPLFVKLDDAPTVLRSFWTHNRSNQSYRDIIANSIPWLDAIKVLIVKFSIDKENYYFFRIWVSKLLHYKQ